MSLQDNPAIQWGAIVSLLGVCAFGAYTTFGPEGDARQGGAPSPSPEVTAAPVPESTGSGQPTAVDPSPSAVPSSSAEQDRDRRGPRDVLEDVVPVWSENDLSAGDSNWEEWSATWQGDPAVGNGFVAASRGAHLYLWGTLSRVGASASGAKVEVVKELWSDGPRSMWRVTVTRKIASDYDQVGLGDTEKVTWDFLVVRGSNGEYKIESFFEPGKKNEDPKNFPVEGAA